MVEIIEAYVDGRPIPRFSNSLTNDASLNRAIGLVKCCLGSSLSNANTSPGLKSGNNNVSCVLHVGQEVLYSNSDRDSF